MQIRTLFTTIVFLSCSNSKALTNGLEKLTKPKLKEYIFYRIQSDIDQGVYINFNVIRQIVDINKDNVPNILKILGEYNKPTYLIYSEQDGRTILFKSLIEAAIYLNDYNIVSLMTQIVKVDKQMIYKALENDNVSVFAFLLDCKKDMNKNLLIKSAIIFNSIEILEYLIGTYNKKEWQDISLEYRYSDVNKYTFLEIAILAQREKAVRKLIDLGADLKRKNVINGLTPLELAKKVKKTNRLLDEGKNINRIISVLSEKI